VLYVILYESLVVAVASDCHRKEKVGSSTSDFSDVYCASLGKTKVQNEEVTALKKLELMMVWACLVDGRW